MGKRTFENTAYSFQDVTLTVYDPRSNLNATSYGEADEGYSVEFEGDKGTVTPGAAGDGQHNLHAYQGGQVVIRTLKGSSWNKVMSGHYNTTTGSAATYGQTVITIRDFARGDTFFCYGCGVRKFPNTGYAKDGAPMEWAFNAIRIEPDLGPGAVQYVA